MWTVIKDILNNGYKKHSKYMNCVHHFNCLQLVVIVTVSQAWDKCATACKKVSTLVWPYPGTALLMRAVRSQYLFLLGWIAPAAPCRRSGFHLFIACFRPSKKVQIAGWWQWKSNWSTWCHPSTEFGVLAIPSMTELLWSHIFMLKSAGPNVTFLLRRCLPRMYVCSVKLTSSFMWS